MEEETIDQKLREAAKQKEKTIEVITVYCYLNFLKKMLVL